MNSRVNSILFKSHFCLLGLILLNFLIESCTGYRLNQSIIFLFKIVLYLSGILLFFRVLRSSRLLAAYFSFYTVSVVSLAFFFLFGGILLAIASSVFLYPINPVYTQYKKDTIKVYSRFQGFMAPCCSYEIVERQMYVFEKHLGYIDLEEPIDPLKDELVLKGNTIVYKHGFYGVRHGRTQDTVETLQIH